jgi:hypothetical protein
MGNRNSTKRPYFKNLTFFAKAKGTNTAYFGYDWDVCVRPVRFFIIEVDYQGIKAIKNVLEGSPSDHCANSRTCIFALADGEAVKRVDVYYSNSCVTGLWFHTNKRASHRIGRFTEYEDRLRVPRGFYLHSFAGKSGYVGYARHIIRLSALLSPLPEASVHDVPRGIMTNPQRTGCACEALPDMRAILVKITNSLEGIYALSARNVAALSAIFQGLKESGGQHMVELLPGERVVAVRLVEGAKVQFVTTHRTTPWYGEEKDGSQDVKVFDVVGKPHGSYICGFHTYSSTDHPKKKKIGVVYWTQTAMLREKTAP